MDLIGFRQFQMHIPEITLQPSLTTKYKMQLKNHHFKVRYFTGINFFGKIEIKSNSVIINIGYYISQKRVQLYRELSTQEMPSLLKSPLQFSNLLNYAAKLKINKNNELQIPLTHKSTLKPYQIRVKMQITNIYDQKSNQSLQIMQGKCLRNKYLQKHLYQNGITFASFIPQITNCNIDSFQIQNNIITHRHNQKHSLLVNKKHCKLRGIQCFKLRVINSKNKNIHFGIICANPKKIIIQTNQPYYMLSMNFNTENIANKIDYHLQTHSIDEYIDYFNISEHLHQDSFQLNTTHQNSHLFSFKNYQLQMQKLPRVSDYLFKTDENNSKPLSEVLKERTMLLDAQRQNIKEQHKKTQQNIYEMTIHHHKNKITWYKNGERIRQEVLPHRLANSKLYSMIAMFDQQDCIEFLK